MSNFIKLLAPQCFIRLLAGLLFAVALCNASLPTRVTGPTAAKMELIAGGGDSSLGGPAVGAHLYEPFGVAFDRAGNWYICEYKGHRITNVDRQANISLFAGTGKVGYNGDGGPATLASFN